MNISIAITNVLGYHYKVALEICIRHLDQNDEVNLLTCKRGMKTCPVNPHHDISTCMLCRSKLKSGFKIDDINKAQKRVLKPRKYEGEIDVPNFESISELKGFEIDGVNHGMEAASSVISALKKPKPNMRRHRELVERCLLTAVALYRAALQEFERTQPDRVYVLNGRYATQRPFVRAAQEKDIELRAWEIGHDSNKYILIEDTYFHDLENKKNEIERYWKENQDEEEKMRKAEKFFKDRRYGSGEEYPEAGFKDEQKKGRVPKEIGNNKREIGIFNSSEHEFAAIEGYGNPIYSDQTKGIEKIVKDERIGENIHFYLRVHPNLENINNYQTRWIDNFENENVTVIPAGSDVDSYALMEKCEKVVTFGSALSIESAYAGKPSILLGREPYEHLNSCYTPKSHEKAVNLVNQSDLPPKSREGAVKYGYYMIERDSEYEYIQPEENTVEGRELKPSTGLHRVFRLIRGNTKEVIFDFLHRKLKKIKRAAS